MRTIPITLMALAALLLLPVGAMGQGTLPPDNAAIDEYVEGVPGPTGKKPSSGVKGGGSKGGGSGDASGGGSGGGSAGGPGAGTLPTGVVTTLQSLGSDGQAVADLAVTAGSGPGGPGARPQGNGGDGDGDGGAAADVADRAGGGSEVEQIVGQTLGTGTAGGMGVLLPLILVVALLGAIVAALQRRRRSGSPE